MHDKTLRTEFSTREIRLNLYYYMFEDLTLSTDIIIKWINPLSIPKSIPSSNNVKANQCEQIRQAKPILCQKYVKIWFTNDCHCTCKIVFGVRRKGLEYGAKICSARVQCLNAEF